MNIYKLFYVLNIMGVNNNFLTGLKAFSTEGNITSTENVSRNLCLGNSQVPR